MIPLSVLALATLAYILFIQPKLDERKANELFNASVIAYLTGLKAEISKFACFGDVSSYTQRQLERAHKLPGNQFLFEYEAPNGWSYTSHTCPDDYPLFGILCVVHFALDTDNEALLDWAHSMLEKSRKDCTTISW